MSRKSVVWLLDDREIRRSAIHSFLSHWAGKAAIDIRPVESMGLIPPVEDGSNGEAAQLCVLATGGVSLAEPELAALVRALIPLLDKRPLAILSDIDSDDEVSLAIESGAHGLVSTGMTASVAVAALEFMLSGGTYFKRSSLIGLCAKKDPADADCLPDMPGADAAAARLRLVSSKVGAGGLHRGDDPRPNLTQRQREIVEMLKLGRSNKEIARLLDISDATVKIFVRQVMKKYGAINRTQVALLASDAMSPMDVVGSRAAGAAAWRPEP